MGYDSIPSPPPRPVDRYNAASFGGTTCVAQAGDSMGLARLHHVTADSIVETYHRASPRERSEWAAPSWLWLEVRKLKDAIGAYLIRIEDVDRLLGLPCVVDEALTRLAIRPATRKATAACSYCSSLADPDGMKQCRSCGSPRA